MNEDTGSVPIRCGRINLLIPVFGGGEVSRFGRGIEDAPAVEAFFPDPPRQPEIDYLETVRMTEDDIVGTQVVV